MSNTYTCRFKAWVLGYSGIGERKKKDKDTVKIGWKGRRRNSKMF